MGGRLPRERILMSFPTWMSQRSAPEVTRAVVERRQQQEEEEVEYLSPAEIYEEYNYPYYGYGYGWNRYGPYGPGGFNHPFYAPYAGYAPQGFGGYGDPYGAYPGRYGYGYPGYLQEPEAEEDKEDKEDKADDEAAAEDQAYNDRYDVRRYGYNRFGIPGPYGYGYGYGYGYDYGYYGGYYGAPWGYGYPHPAASYRHPGPYPLGYKLSDDERAPKALTPQESLHQQAYDFQPDISGSYPTWARY